MDLIFIYGQPATGKLTIARQLEKNTNFKLFHNHLSVDLIKPIFPWGTPEFSDVNRKIRLMVFDSAAKSRKVKGMIFTFCFRPGKNDTFVKKVIKIIKKNGGKIHFIFLECDEKELFKRVKNKDRKKHTKVRSVKDLKKDMHHWGEISFVENIKIDNTKISPRKASQIIAEKCGLEQNQKK